MICVQWFVWVARYAFLLRCDYSSSARAYSRLRFCSLALEYVSFLFTLASISRHYSGVAPGLDGLQPLVRRVYLSGICDRISPILLGLSDDLDLNTILIAFAYIIVRTSRFLSIRNISNERYVYSSSPRLVMSPTWSYGKRRLGINIVLVCSIELFLRGLFWKTPYNMIAVTSVKLFCYSFHIRTFP